MAKYFSAAELTDLKEETDLLVLSKALNRVELVINDIEDEIDEIKGETVEIDDLDLSGLDKDEIDEIKGALSLIVSETEIDLKEAERSLKWHKTVKKELKKALRSQSTTKKDEILKSLSKKGKKGKKGKKAKK